MGKIGLAYLAAAKMATEPAAALPTYHPGFVVGKAVAANLGITNASGQLYADNKLAEEINEFSNAALTCEADNIDLVWQAELYGEEVVDGEVGDHSSDTAPYIGFGYYQVLLVRNVRKYVAFFYPKAKATLPDDAATSKTNSISIGTSPLNLTIMEPEYGKWRYRKEFVTEAAAQAYIDSKLGVAEWFTVNVQAQGMGANDAVAPLGNCYVSSAGTFELEITGTPTALYDNGVECHADISDGKYTLTNVALDHTIAVIF